MTPIFKDRKVIGFTCTNCGIKEINKEAVEILADEDRIRSHGFTEAQEIEVNLMLKEKDDVISSLNDKIKTLELAALTTESVYDGNSGNSGENNSSVVEPSDDGLPFTRENGSGDEITRSKKEDI